MELNRNSNKVLFLFCTSFPYLDGEIYLEDELKVIASRFNKILIFTMAKGKGKAREIPKNAEVIHVDLERVNPKWFFIKSLFSFRILIREMMDMRVMGVPWNSITLKDAFWTLKRGFQLEQIIHSYLTENRSKSIVLYSYWNNYLAFGISRIKGESIKTIARGHGFDVFFERLPFSYHPFIRTKIKNLNHLVICSDFGCRYLMEKEQFRNMKSLSVSKLGVLGTTKKTINIQKRKLTILTISYFVELKRLPLLAEALALNEEFDLSWIHIGEGFTKVEEYKDYLKGILSNNSRVEVSFRGNLTRNEVLKTFEQEPIDLLVNTSSTEGLPVSIMEAFSFGIPAIATNVGGVPEIVNSSNGYLLQANPTPIEIWHALRSYFLLSETDQAQLKDNAFNTWLENYNATINYTRFAEQYLN